MDTTTIGIAGGVIVSLAYSLIGSYYKKIFELNHTVLIFLASFSVPGGLALIIAGFNGKPTDLPSSWREHVVVAGIVAIGLAVQYIYGTFKGCFILANQSDEANARKKESES